MIQLMLMVMMIIQVYGRWLSGTKEQKVGQRRQAEGRPGMLRNYQHFEIINIKTIVILTIILGTFLSLNIILRKKMGISIFMTCYG